jgi:chaperonin cofactor prefoldin
MKAVLFLTLVAFAPAAKAADSNPLGKVLELMADLKAKITKEGVAEEKAFKEYFAWCDDTSKNGGFAIKTATDTKAKLEAKIDKLTGEISASDSKIEELAADIATQTGELKDATSIRDKEKADFSASEAEMMDAIDTLGRAVGIISKEMAKNPASFAQVDGSNMKNLIAAIGSVLDAAAFSSTDQKKLVALVQAQQTSQNDDEELGAPASAQYKSHSTGIIDVLEDMKDKAEGQLAELRKAETNSQHNYDMLKQSLTDEITADNTDLEQEKSSKAAAEEGKATA